MDNAVYTFEQMLHQSLEAQGTEELCKTVQRCQDRVLKVNRSHRLIAVLLLPLMSSQARRSSRTAGLDACQTPPQGGSGLLSSSGKPGLRTRGLVLLGQRLSSGQSIRPHEDWVHVPELVHGSSTWRDTRGSAEGPTPQTFSGPGLHPLVPLVEGEDQQAGLPPHRTCPRLVLGGLLHRLRVLQLCPLMKACQDG